MQHVLSHDLGFLIYMVMSLCIYWVGLHCGATMGAVEFMQSETAPQRLRPRLPSLCFDC